MRYVEACKILNVKADCNLEEIKSAYRIMVKKYHPDVNKSENAQENFHIIQEAYNLLEDVVNQKNLWVKEATDQVSQQYSQEEVSYERILRQVPVKGSDVFAEVNLKLLDIFNDTFSNVSFIEDKPCERCGTTGSEPHSPLIICPKCRGNQDSCAWCGGEGEIPQEVCKDCKGKGVVDSEKNVRIKIPRSIYNHAELIIDNQGKWGKEKNGDLKIKVSIDEGDMKRIDNSIEAPVYITFLQAVLGGHAEVYNIDNKIYKFKIPAGTSSGEKFVIKNKGLYLSDSEERGDLIINILVKIPSNLTVRERYFFEKLLQEDIKKNKKEMTVKQKEVLKENYNNLKNLDFFEKNNN